MPRSLAISFEEVMRQEREGVLAHLVRCLLAPLGLCSGLWIKIKNKLYDVGALPVHKGPLPVVSVGNLVVGGVGKTPFVRLLAQALAPAGKVAILSRGYRSGVGKRPFVVDAGAARGGDEALMLARTLKNALVIVGQDRLAGVRLAAKLGAKIVLLDDGMQHRRLHRNVEIALLHATHPWGSGHFLPHGILRDDPSRLAACDLIIAVGEGYTGNAQVPVVEVDTTCNGVYDLEGKRLTLNGEKVALFCAIGAPSRFVRTVQEELRTPVVARYFLGDHKSFAKIALLAFAKEAKQKGAKLLLCTEKDKVKIPKDWVLPLPCAWVSQEMVIRKNGGALGALVERIKESMSI